MNNRKSKLGSYLLYFIVFLALIGLDQWTKYLVVAKLKDNSPFVLMKDVFEFYYHENTGAVWGIMSDQTFLLAMITLVIIVVIGLYFVKLPHTKRMVYMRVVLVVLSAGAVGNLIDRVARKYVVDFLYFKLIDFPIFNVADIYVTVSAVVLMLLSFFYYKDNELDVFKKK